MRLSACSIVKNEAKNIARSIESYKDVVDEIIIVDTGSTDNTVEICKSLGAKVLHFEWINDFAAAKNYALDHAKGEWVIFLDADEWFVPQLTDDRIFKVLNRVEKMDNVGIIKTILCNVDEKTGFISAKNTSARIFKNGPDVRYVGKIHEDIFKGGQPIKQVTLEELEIYHSGYSGGKVTAKSARNLEILYDVYRQGQAETATYFYLCRENAILGNYQEALKFHDLFFGQEDYERVIAVANLYVSVYEHSIVIQQNNLDKFTSADIVESIDLAITKYPEIPKHYYLKGIHYFNSDYDIALAAFQEAIRLDKGYKGKYINTFAHSIPDTYYRMAQIYRAKNMNEEAFDYYVLALQEQPLQEGAFRELIQLIRTQPNEEIIAFINSIYDISDADQVKFLAKQLMLSRLHLVFLYYAKKYNQEFDGQDETTYMAMILSNNEETAVQTAMTAYFNAGKEDDRFFASLAILSKKRRDLYDQYKASLNPVYSSILNKYLNGDRLKNPSQEEIDAFVRLYQHLFYIGSAAELEELEGLFEELPLVVAASLIESYVSNKDHSLIIAKALSYLETLKSEHFKTQLHKLLGFSYFAIHDYAQSVEHFRQALESEHVDLDHNIIIYLKSFADINADELTTHKASKLYESYAPIFEEYIRNRNILRTGKFEEAFSVEDLSKVSTMDGLTFHKEIEAEDTKLSDLVLNTYFNLMEKYVENDLDISAHDMAVRLLKQGYKKDILYFRLGEIYTRLNNPTMSLYCHKKVFEENATFAATLIADQANSNRNYVYKPLLQVKKLEHCPLCGSVAPLQAVYNTLVSSDFSPKYPPLKIWRYCHECRHMFAAEYTEEISSNMDTKKAKEAIKNMAASISGYAETIHHIVSLAPGKRLLDIGSGNGQFLAAALEYGFEPVGIELDENLAALSSRILNVPVHHCRFEDFDTAESYDLITMGQGLERMSDPKTALKKVYELLHRGGLFYIETPNFDSGFARVMQDKDRTLRSARMGNYFSYHSLESLLQSCGFQVLSYGMSKRNHGYMEIIVKRNV